MNTMDLILRS